VPQRPIPVQLPAALVAIAAFALYRATMLPGVDFGDTGSFQTIAGSALITPRDGYPLYFAIGQLFLWITRAEAAHALNLASAAIAAIACGLIVPVAARISGSIGAAVGAALLFAASYTFWSQAVIAEVYALHIALVTLTLLLLLRWAERPTPRRLTLFFAAYAIAFGNHLAMILLAPAFTLFLFLEVPGGWRSLVTPRIVTVAIVCAVAGASQYWWNLRTLWLLPGVDPPAGAIDALQRFWFDVTKSDWRDTMVMNVPRSMVSDHAAMYWFDLKQQFGVAGPILALAGLVEVARANLHRALLLFLLYATNAVFAFSYNVGDTHVFYLPSHLFVALLAAPAVVLAGRLAKRRFLRGAVAGLLVLYAGARAYRDFPALDRSRDDRPSTVLGALTAGLDDRRAVLLADLNWQVQNGLSYLTRARQPEIAVARMPDVALYAPALVADNRAIGREVVLTERARATAAAAYGPLLPIAPDARVAVPRLTDTVRDVTPGTRYVVCVLRPSRDLRLDAADLAGALQSLAGGRAVDLPTGDYTAVAGVAGAAPALVTSSEFPFSRRVTLDGVAVDIRMESWLAADTIRRMGFGHVIAGRRHTLIVERGVSLVTFDAQGSALRTAYAANIFAPQPRYLIDIAPAFRH
jgi:transmembrane protein TMEM260 (protein O-mannosyltransferase)